MNNELDNLGENLNEIINKYDVKPESSNLRNLAKGLIGKKANKYTDRQLHKAWFSFEPQ